MFSVVITNFNTWALTRRCVSSILKFDGDQVDEIIVVDDASSEPRLHFDDSRVEIIQNERNAGYNACVNIGIRRARSPFVLLLDADARLLEPLMTACEKEFLRNSNLCVIGFRLVDEAGHPTGASSPYPTVIGLVLGQRLGSLLEGSISKSRALHACALALRKAAFEDMGGFDERFEFLDGDMDFSIRLRASGWQEMVLEDISVYHVGGGVPQTTSRRVLRFHRDRLALLRKHGKIRWPWAVRMILLVRHGIEASILLLALPFRRSEAIKDKLSGRMRLMRTVLRDYQ